MECYIEFWGDNVEPSIDPVIKILARDLWLSNEEQDVCDQLDCVVNAASWADFRSGRSFIVPVILMQKYKNSTRIQQRCHVVVLGLHHNYWIRDPNAF
jgi:hypothetical protein